MNNLGSLSSAGLSPLPDSNAPSPQQLALDISRRVDIPSLTLSEKILFAATLLNGTISLLAASGYTSEEAGAFLTATTDHLFGMCQWGVLLANANLDTAKALLFSGMIETVGRFYPTLRLCFQTGLLYKIAQRAFQGIQSSWDQSRIQGWRAWVSSGARIVNALGSLSSMHKSVQTLFSEKRTPDQCSIAEKPNWKISDDLFTKATQGEWGEEIRFYVQDKPYYAEDKPLIDFSFSPSSNLWRVLSHATQAQITDSYEQWAANFPEICRLSGMPALFQALQKTPLSAENLKMNGSTLKDPSLHRLFMLVTVCKATSLNYKVSNTPLILHGYIRSLYEEFSPRKLEEIGEKYQKATLEQLKEPLQSALVQIDELTQVATTVEDYLENLSQQETLKEALSELLAILYSPSFSALSRTFEMTKEQISETLGILNDYSMTDFINLNDEINGYHVVLIHQFVNEKLREFLEAHSTWNQELYNYFLTTVPNSVEKFVETQLPLSPDELKAIRNRYQATDLKELQKPFQKLVSQWSSFAGSSPSQIPADFFKDLLAIASCPSLTALRYRDDPIPFQRLQDIEETIQQEEEITIRHQVWIAQILSNLRDAIPLAE